MNTCIIRLPADSATKRRWTGRDELGHHVGRIPRNQSPVTMALFWKKDKTSKPTLVGCYRIDLECLCAHGYARYDKADNVILKFQRTHGRIEIAINRSKPALRIGRNPLGQTQ